MQWSVLYQDLSRFVQRDETKDICNKWVMKITKIEQCDILDDLSSYTKYNEEIFSRSKLFIDQIKIYHTATCLDSLRVIIRPRNLMI
jgi:hypothetical protein